MLAFSSESPMSHLLDTITSRYRTDEFPALLAQARQWAEARPFAGLRLLDATPVFRNTLAKYHALIAAGAELTVSADPRLPSDPAVVASLSDFGIRTAGAGRRHERFDCVLDCAGLHADVTSSVGYVELTRSGGTAYRSCAKPVFWADDSRIKEIETGLGTGDGFRRALRQLGHGDLKGRSLVLFGCGKVGRGVILCAVAEGAHVTVVDDASLVAAPPCGVALVDLHDRAGIEAAVRAAWCVVSATGVRGAVCSCIAPRVLTSSPALLANLGVEDEFGDAVPEERVLNAKRPLNFLLGEPTRLRYIDPAMALHNAGVEHLLQHRALPPGLFRPPAALEESVLDAVRRHGVVAAELARLEESLTWQRS